VHIPESIKHGAPFFRPVRAKDKELTGGDGTPQFWPQHTGDTLLPNPSASCTWNVATPPSPVPQRTYLKTANSPSKSTEGDALVSASQVEMSGASGSG
jgi:hypothetical protein